MVESLETTAFLNALQQFLCITGNKTRHIRADCATTFIRARNKLNGDTTQMAKRLEYSADVQSYLKKCSIIWEFSTPASSHHQGLLERHIRTFKEVTKGVLGADNKKRSPSEFELMTLFREDEYIMNCRPLGKSISDEDDVEALRPIDLMNGFLKPSFLKPKYSGTTFQDKFRRGYIYTRRLAEEWWDRWLRHHHAVLLEHQKWTEPQQNLREGDLVLLIDVSTPPVGCYPYAIVTAFKTCADGMVRFVTIRTIDGRICTRDIRKIILLETQNSEDDDTQNEDGDRDIPIHDKPSCAMRLDDEDKFDPGHVNCEL